MTTSSLITCIALAAFIIAGSLAYYWYIVAESLRDDIRDLENTRRHLEKINNTPGEFFYAKQYYSTHDTKKETAWAVYKYVFDSHALLRVFNTDDKEFNQLLAVELVEKLNEKYEYDRDKRL